MDEKSKVPTVPRCFGEGRGSWLQMTGAILRAFGFKGENMFKYDLLSCHPSSPPKKNLLPLGVICT